MVLSETPTLLGSLIHEPSWKKFSIVIILFFVFVVVMLGYDEYTQNTRLNKMEKVTLIMEKIHNLKQDGAFESESDFTQAHQWLKQELDYLTFTAAETQGNRLSVMSRFFLGGIIWYCLAVAMVPLVFKKDKSKKNTGIGGLFIFLVLALASGAIVHLIAPNDASVLTLSLFTIVPITFLILVIAILLPALGAARRTARKMQESTEKKSQESQV